MQRPEKVKKTGKANDLADAHIIEKAKLYLRRNYEFRYNTITLTNEFRPRAAGDDFRPLEDREENTIWLNAQVDGLQIPVSVFSRILKSDFIPEFNAITDFFGSLQWDGLDHIAALARTVTIQGGPTRAAELMARNWPYFLRRWLIGVAACAVNPAIKNDFCLILSGPQGVGKTTWLNRLVPPALTSYAHSGHINPSLTDRNTAAFIAEKFLINVDDQFEIIFGRDFNAMKAIISADSATIRKAYDRNHKRRPRIASFCGSVNSTDFLTDEENRRYLCFIVSQIRHRHNLDMEQVWAQAYAAYKRGEPYFFTREEVATHREINELFTVVGAEQELLMKCYTPGHPDDPDIEWLQKTEILSELQLRSGLKLSARKLGQALRKAGFGEGISKRVERFNSPRYMIPVLRRDVQDDEAMKRELERDFKGGDSHEG